MATAVYDLVSRKSINGWLLVAVAVPFVISFLLSTVAGKGAHLPAVSLLTGALAFATPLVPGALSGVVNEAPALLTSIEGQLLFGAFMGAVVASIAGNAYVGLIGAPIAGALVGALLALFTINFRTDHIIVGVVLNMLVLGLTSFLFSTVLKFNAAELNSINRLPNLKIPFLADIPVIGPILFNQSILVYIMFISVIMLQFMVFNSRGSRMRACGEHPRAGHRY